MAEVTLDELLEEVGLSPAELNKACTFEHRQDIALFLESWRTVAPHLGLSEVQVEEVENDGRTEKEKRRKILESWKAKFAFRATYIVLVKALLKISRADQAELVCRLLRPKLKKGSLLASRSQAVKEYHLLVCPCGECTVDSYFDNGCPKMPKCISASQDRTFPYLDTSNLTEEEMQDLEDRLLDDTKTMIYNYSRLVTSTNRSLQKQEVNPKDLAVTVLSLGLFQTYENQQPVLSKVGEKIQNASSIQVIFLELMCYWSFFNYELLEHIIQVYGSTEDKEELQMYLDDLEKFCQRRIFEVPQCVYGNESNKGSWAKFVVKLDDEIQKLQDLRDVRRKIAKILGLQSPALYLCDIAKGCVEVVFMIPQLVAHEIFPLSDDQQNSLLTNHVVKNSCNLQQCRESTAPCSSGSRGHLISHRQFPANEQRPKQKLVQSYEVSVHIHHQCPQQNPSNQCHENPMVDTVTADSSMQPHTSSLTPTTTEDNMNSQPSMSLPPSPKCHASSQMPSHEASGGASPQQVSTPIRFPDEHPASFKFSTATDTLLLGHSELHRRHKSPDEVKDAPGDSLAVDPEMHHVKAFLQRCCQTKPCTLFQKYYAGNRRMKEIVGMIFLVFFVYQALASFLVTIWEGCEFWSTLIAEEVYINILLQFILRISVRIIAPLCSLFQLHRISVEPQLTSMSSGRQELDKSLREFEGSLQRHIESRWITVVHAALFPILLLFMGAFEGVEESLAEAKMCVIVAPLNVFIQVCECISTFFILLVMGLAKDRYCYENKIATHILTFGNSGKEMCKKIRRRWLILDIYCYITSVGFTVFTGLSILAGKAFTPDPSQNLDVDDLVTWYIWISFLSLLLYLGFTSPRYVKSAGLACYGLVFILMLVSKMPIRVLPGRSIVLVYITLGMSVFDLLVCLFSTRCRQKKSKEPFSCALFVLSFCCLLLLPVSGMAVLLREIIHFAHFVVLSNK